MIANIELRNMVHDKGIHWKTIAKLIGVSDEYLSRCLRYQLKPEMERKIKMAIDKYPEPISVSEIKPLTDKQRIEICKSTKQKLIDAERFTNNKWSYDKVDSNAVEDAICMLGDYIEMLEALIKVKRRQRAKQLGEAIEKMKEGKENEKNNC